MYRPLKIFTIIGGVVSAVGIGVIVRWLVISEFGRIGGNVQSLILAAMLIMVGVQFIVAGMQADIIAANRKILEDVQYRVRKIEYNADKSVNKYKPADKVEKDI